MAKIEKVEIICRTCHRCEALKEKVIAILQSLERHYGIKIKYKLVHRDSKREIMEFMTSFGYTLKELPVLLINGKVVFFGHVPGTSTLRIKFTEIMKS